MDKETQNMIAEFVSEGFDALDTNEPLIEELAASNNSEQINAIFRVFHTLKGLSGFFEMRVLHHLTHEAETMLDLIRKQNKPQSEDVISVIYATFDLLRNILQIISVEHTDTAAQYDVENMVFILNSTMQEISEKDNKYSQDLVIDFGQDEDTSTNTDYSSDNISDSNSNNFSEESNSNSSLDMQSFISPEMIEQYLASSMELVELSENNLIILEKEPDNEALVAETFGAIHSLKGNSGFMGYKEIEEISIDIETILDSLRNKELEIDQNIVTILLSSIEQIKTRLIAIKGTESKADQIIRENSEVEKTISQTQKIEDSEIEKDYQNDKNIETINEHNSHPANKQQKLKEVSAIKKDQFSNNSTIQRNDIRVETNKIDKLFDLVGELITIESMVTKNPDITNLELPNFMKAANMLNKITRELQEISMSIRMMPIESLFNKMKRLVRDVSIKMKKKIELEISGQETEMDKNVIDEIADPLVHILRNAIDHGVESPETRLANGKSETGKIKLSAKYEGNEILIVIEDDGAGINRNIIVEKAIERGLISANDKLTDKEVFMLIFEPGFSTAKQITDISGRGVGMDVVKKNIEKLRGSIDIDSKLNFGSTFTLRIPLTLAIMESMLIRIGDSQFALPILSLRESFKCQKENITVTMDGLEVVKIRKEVLPIIRIHELLNIETTSKRLEDGILMVIETRDKRVCLFADEIVGQQQAVIKGLSEYIGKVAGIMGCMILGDGSIGLILDIESLIALADISEAA